MHAPIITLTILKDGNAYQSLTLESGALRLGRAEDNEICLADIGVSRRHARVVIEGGAVLFEDSGSGNGSWFNNQRIQSQQIMDGDVITIEPFTLKFSIIEPIVEGTDHTDRTIVLKETLPIDAESEFDAPDARLELESAQGTRESRYEISPEGLTMGRADQRDIVLQDPAASRLHAEIVLRGNRFWIRDAGSANGLAVNDRRVQEHPLVNGDVIRIGATELKYIEQVQQPYHTEVLDEAPVERTEAFMDPVSDADEWGAPPDLGPGVAAAASGLPPARTTPSRAGIPHTPTTPSSDGLSGGDSPWQSAPPPASGFDSAAAPAAFAAGAGGFGGGGFGAPAGNDSPWKSEPDHPVAPPAYDAVGEATDASPEEELPPPAAAPMPFAAPPPQATAPPMGAPPQFAAPGGAPPPFAPPPGAPGAPPPAFAAPGGAAPFAMPGGAHPGASPPNMGPPPDLGAAVADGGFGGMEMDVSGGGGKKRRGKKRRKQKKLKVKSDGFWAKPINRISGGLLILSLIGVGGRKVFDLAGGSLRSGGGTSSDEVTDIGTMTEDDQLRLAQINRQMDEGMRLFQGAKYLEAADKFLKVIQLDPSHEAAKRMGFLSCEFITIQAMQASVAERAMDDAERQKVRDEALAAYEEAKKNAYQLRPAQTKIDEALEVNSGDAELIAAKEDLGQRIGNAAVAAASYNLQKLEKEVEALYEQGQGELSRSNYNAAIKYFEQVLVKDMDRKTSTAPKAEEGIRRAKSEMARGARESYQAGLAAMRGGDFLGARAKFRETLRIDPYNASAQSKLGEAQAQLETMASTEFKKGKTMEQANQPDRAMGHYNQVLVLIDNRGNPTYQNAQARIQALLE